MIEVLRKAEDIVRKYTLCDSCLGRLFGLRGYGLENSERGRSIKTLLLMKSYRAGSGVLDEGLLSALARSGFEPASLLAERYGIEVLGGECYICGGLMDRLGEYGERVVRLLGEYEFDSFQVGSRIPEDAVRREEDLWSLYGLEDSESLKNEFTRRLGKILSSRMGKRYSLSDPDIVVLVDLGRDSVEIRPRPLYVYGRYRKYVRGLPQNPWLHEDRSRIRYDTSIEELISGPLMEAAGSRSAKFHAAGREDVDVRTLGPGRPFVVELKEPRHRNLDLSKVGEEINRRGGGLIEVEGLRLVDRAMVPRLKAMAELSRKTYVARVKFDGDVAEEDLRELEEKFRNVVISQKTPRRMLRRRTDRVRKKVLYEVRAEKLGEGEVRFTMVCQGGLYVKELIHGDEGRTTPSFSEFLGRGVEEIELDVVDIEEVS